MPAAIVRLRSRLRSQTARSAGRRTRPNRFQCPPCCASHAPATQADTASSADTGADRQRRYAQLPLTIVAPIKNRLQVTLP
jgi:hypothetical protein